MRSRSRPRIAGLVILSVLFNLNSSCSPRASLRLSVGSGARSAPSPPPRAIVHLLDIDPIELVSTGGDEQSPRAAEAYRAHPRLKELAGLMNARRQAAYSLGPDVFLFLDQSRPVWEPHVLRSAQTDAEGRAKLDDLAPGSYWLMCYCEEPGSEAFWSRRVMIEDGANEVALERSEALYSR